MRWWARPVSSGYENNIPINAKTPEEAIAYYRESVNAGERALGKKASRRMSVIFGACFVEGRSARGGNFPLSGHAAFKLGRQSRHSLSAFDQPSVHRKDKESAKLHKAYDDGLADWAWSKTLLSFRTKGDNPESRKALAEALKTNKYVSVYLLGRKKMPKTTSNYISPSDTSEAVAYVENALEAWQVALGSLKWVEKAVKAMV